MGLLMLFGRAGDDRFGVSRIRQVVLAILRILFIPILLIEFSFLILGSRSDPDLVIADLLEKMRSRISLGETSSEMLPPWNKHRKQSLQPHKRN
jgi:hypothetical protein